MASQEKEPAYQQSLALGWMAMAVLMVMTMVAPLVHSAIQTDFSEYAYHPGPNGLDAYCVAISVYVGMAVLTQRLDFIWLRWLNVALFLSVTLFELLHQVMHFRNGMVHGLMLQVMDIVHHLIGIWMVALAYRWLRSGKYD